MGCQNWFDDPGLRQFTCYRLKLSPLSVGHLFLLRELNSPYVTQQLHTESDLRLATLVCSAPWSESRHFVSGTGLFRLIWKTVTALCDFEHENSAFEHYWASHFHGITTKTKVPHPQIGVSTYESPIEWNLLASLMRDFRFSYEAAMEFSVWKALRLKTVLGELDGTIDIVSDDLMALFDFAQRERVNEHGRPSSESHP